MNVTGTKLACSVCGAQVVVVKGGSGDVLCHDQPMAVVAGAAGSTVRPTGERDPGGDRES